MFCAFVCILIFLISFAYVWVYMCKSVNVRGQLARVHTLHLAGPGDEAEVVRLGGKSLNLQNHSANLLVEC